ncbi:hypothetical protein Tco_0532132 [Tanacetum coccineum]
MDAKCLLEAKIGKKEILKETMGAQRVYTLDYMETENAQDVGRTRDIVGEEKENDEDVLSTDKEKVSTDKEKVSTDKEKVSTDRPIVSTDGSKVSTDRQKDSTDEQSKAKVSSQLCSAKALVVSRREGEERKQWSKERYFSTLMRVLSIFDRDDLNAVYQLVMDRYQNEIPEGFDKVLWGGLMIMFNPDDEDKFWNSQQDWNIVSWKLHGSSGVHTLMTGAGLVSYAVEKKFQLL